MIDKVKDIDLHEHKMDYIKKLIAYLENRVETWSDELQELVDSPGFDFLELKPLFSEPHELVHYVTRCNAIILG